VPRGARTTSSVASTVPIRLWTTHRPSCGSHFLDLLSCKWTIHGPTIPSSIMRPYEQGTSSHTRAQLLLLYEITKNVKSRKKTVQDYRAGGQPAGARTNCCYDMTGRRRCLPSNTDPRRAGLGRAWREQLWRLPVPTSTYLSYSHAYFLALVSSRDCCGFCRYLARETTRETRPVPVVYYYSSLNAVHACMNNIYDTVRLDRIRDLLDLPLSSRYARRHKLSPPIAGSL